MSILPGRFMARRPDQFRVTVMDTIEDVGWYRLDGGRALADEHGNVRLPGPDGVTVEVPLLGLYRIQRLEDGVPVPGPGLLLTRDQFQAQFEEWSEPHYEYGIRYVPRPRDIVVHGSLEAAQAALEQVPVLGASGDYAIVRRLVTEPGLWEELPAPARRGAR
ncbi:hypothetical protein [Sinomonas atrocyanea]